MNFQFNDSSITVAIVGCGGFVGSHLLDAILARTQWRVFGVDLDFYRIQHRLNDERCEFMVADLADRSVVERIAPIRSSSCSLFRSPSWEFSLDSCLPAHH